MNILIIILKILSFLILGLFLYMNISVWINARAPLNVIFTVPKIMYPNIVVPVSVVYGILIVIVVSVMFFKHEYSNSVYLKTVLIFLSVFLINSLVLITMLKSSESSVLNECLKEIEYKGKTDIFTESDFKLTEYQEISNLKLFIPRDCDNKKTLLLYLPYGNWRVHENLSISGYLKDTVIRGGFSFGYLSCSGRYESDIFKIVSELKRGIKLIKDDDRFDFKNIILSGGSAGGHISLLTAYSQYQDIYDQFDTKVTVDGIVAFYSPTDMFIDYDKFVTNAGNEWYDKIGDRIYSTQDNYPSLKESHIAAMETLFGGKPDTCEELYRLGSPVELIHDEVPPTLIIHGEHDSMTSFKAADNFYIKLKRKNLNADFVSLKNTDHAFDTMLQRISIPVDIAYTNMIKWLDKNYRQK